MDPITLTAEEEENIRSLQTSIEQIRAKLDGVIFGIRTLSDVLTQVMNMPVVTRLCCMEKAAAQQRAEVATQRSELQGHIEKMKLAFPFLKT